MQTGPFPLPAPGSGTGSEPEPPTLVVHGAEDLRLAIGSVRAAGLRRVRLLSAPAAACFLGPAWWRALMRLAEPTGAVATVDVLDCGDAPGRALEALRLGQRMLVLEPSPQWRTVAERAALVGATVLDQRPSALDLAAYGASYRLPVWLAQWRAAAAVDDSGPAAG